LRLDGSKLTLAEYWRLCPEPVSFLIVLVRLWLGWPPRFHFVIPRPERLTRVSFEELPRSARSSLEPAVLRLEEAGLWLAFSHRSEVPEPHRLGVAAILLDPKQETYVAVMFVQERMAQRQEVCCVSLLTDGTRAGTTTTRQTFEPDPLYRVDRQPGLDPVTLLQRHREHLARLACAGLFSQKLTLARLEEAVLKAEQRFVDFHAARGIFVPMADEETP
jgi:hypothetical protein